MRTLLALFLVFPNLVNANAGEVFDGYASYYSILEGAIFKSSDARALQPYSVVFDTSKGSKSFFGWEGEVNGKRYSFFLIDRSIYESDDEGPKESFILNDRKFYFKKAKIFPGVIVGEINSHAASLYINKSYLCLEGVGLGSSGTSQRHRDVYLLPLMAKDRKQHLYKLPSLFASCLGIRQDKSGNLIFPKVSYRNYESVNTADGVNFQDYTFKTGQFVPVGPELKANFVEPDNVYKFRLQ